MSDSMTVRELAAANPDMHSHDYKWADSPEYRDLAEVLAEHGWELAEEDADIAGEYNDLKAYYGCRLVPFGR